MYRLLLLRAAVSPVAILPVTSESAALRESRTAPLLPSIGRCGRLANTLSTICIWPPSARRRRFELLVPFAFPQVDRRPSTPSPEAPYETITRCCGTLPRDHMDTYSGGLLTYGTTSPLALPVATPVARRRERFATYSCYDSHGLGSVPTRTVPPHCALIRQRHQHTYFRCRSILCVTSTRDTIENSAHSL